MQPPHSLHLPFGVERLPVTAIGVGDGREGGSVEVSHPSHPITLDHDRPDRPKGAVEGLLGVCVRGARAPLTPFTGTQLRPACRPVTPRPKLKGS